MKKLSMFFVVALALAGCEKGAKIGKTQPIPEVNVVKLKTQDVFKTSKVLGRIEPLAKVKIRSQAQGILVAKHFEEGQAVKKGDLLFEIDAEPYEAALKQQESLVLQAKSALALAEVKYKMARTLADKDVLSDLDQEQVKVDRDVAEAALAKSKADLEQAKIGLRRTKVYSPVDGVAGEFDNEVGEVIGILGGLGGIVEITVNDKVQVYVQLDEKKHAKFLMNRISDDYVAHKIEIELADGTVYDSTGHLNYIGTEVSKTTGTVTYRAVFPNPDGLLLGGQNVTVIATQAKAKTQILIPQAAVQEDQVGRYVFTVDAENTVKKSYITVGQRNGANWEVVKGLNEGDQLIVAGLLKAKPGKKVVPVVEGK